MASREDEDDDGAEELGRPVSIDPTSEIGEVCDDLVRLLKNPDVVGALAVRGINASLALLAIDGLSAYLAGDKAQAAEDLRAVAEEIEARLRFGNDPPAA